MKILAGSERRYNEYVKARSQSLKCLHDEFMKFSGITNNFLSEHYYCDTKFVNQSKIKSTVYGTAIT